jgi:hypothetical protein
MLWVAALLTAPVSLSFGPAALSDFAPKLKELWGQEVRIDSRLQREVVVVEASDVSTEDLKAKIADVVCGVWKEKDGVLRLNLDLQKEADRRAEYDAKIGFMFRDARRDYVNSLRAQALVWTIQEVSARWEEEEKVGEAPWSPVERAVGQAVAELSDAEFGSLMRQVTFTYSDAPHPGSARWGEEAGELIGKGVEDQTALLHLLQDRGVQMADDRPIFDPYNTPITTPPKGKSYTVLFGHNHNPFAPPRTSHGQELNLQVFHLDADGRILGDAKIRIPGVSWFGYSALALDFKPDRLAGADKAFLAVDPTGEEAEPLARLAGDGFRRMARDLGRDICLCLPDSYMPRSIRPLTHAQALVDLGGEPVAVSDREGWLSGAPFDPIWCRANRLDRGELAEYVAECRSKKILPIRERLLHPGSLRVFCADWRTNIASNVLGAERMSNAADVILGKLSDGTLRNFADGQVMRFGGLPKADQEAIWATALESSAYVSWELDGGFRNLIQRNEVRFGWPKGIPKDALVRLVLEKIQPGKDTREARLEIVGEGRQKLSFYIAFPKVQQ